MFKTKKKFNNKYVTNNGSKRAFVDFTSLETLWFNTGTLCNLSCKGCYIESSPFNDRLLYLNIQDVKNYLKEMKECKITCKKIGITGGEPFMNKDIIEIIYTCLKEDYEVLVLTNAMQPMQNKLKDLEALSKYPKLTFRISLDHYNKYEHELIRGKKTWDRTLVGIKWLNNNNFNINVASRILNENEKILRVGFAKLFKNNNFNIDAYNKNDLVLFPDMDQNNSTPEITTECWNILNVNPKNLMCSNSRMIVKRKEDKRTCIVACTLIAYQNDFSYGNKLKKAFKRTYLNHPNCSKFCVLGGATCSN